MNDATLPRRPLAGRLIVVTGASRGIGAATAVELARRGAELILIARTQGGLEETDDAIRAAGGHATLLPIDINDGAGTDAIGPSIHARFGRLDGLVHAAATLGILTPVTHIREEDWNDVVATNLTATWRLIRTLGPLLVAAEAGRAVFVTSSRARGIRAFWGGYAATKAAMESLVLTWADEVADTRLRINLFDPGATATRMRRRAFPGEDIATLRKPADVAPGIADLCGTEEVRHAALVK